MRQMKSFLMTVGLACVPVALAACGNASGGSGMPPSTGNGGLANGGSANNAGSISNGGNGGQGYVVTGGSTSSDACSGTNPPVSCTMKAPPGCGDGIVQADLGEKCDDGNTLAGDGCSGTCQVEPNHICPTPGQPCILSYKCGDGVVNPGEVCDQGTYQGSPGCSADCTKQDPGYKCIAGQQCVALFACGNGRIETGETCDPPNPGKGCDATCQTETGWRCVPGSCSPLPYCGDGIVQADLGEKCDEGQFKGQPGCSADCKTVDASCTCTPGKACVCQTPVCGDGKVQVGEQCDDGNSQYPGCSATCQLEPGYQCPFAGAPCVPVCGDGIVVKPAEQCDPGSKTASVAQACNSDCSVKPGWACDDSGCHQTKCGDGKVEGSEGCDPLPANNDLGDGCTPTCMAEPTCPAAGGGCTTKCGDGLILGSEECDDGNAVSGDGCSADCKVEDGFTCEQPALGDTMDVPMVVRDFDDNGNTDDFEKGAAFATDLFFANQGLLQPTLDSNGLKPVLAKTAGTSRDKTGAAVASQDSGIASPDSYKQWYTDGLTGVNKYRGTLASSLKLFLIDKSDPPTYVNRYGNNGDGLTATQYQSSTGLTSHFCGNVGQEDHDANNNPIPCTFCPYDQDPTTPQCDPAPQSTDCTKNPNYLYCIQAGNPPQWYGVYTQINFDGNPLFFPADAFPKPWSPDAQGQISGNYDQGWPMDTVVDPATGKPRTHNFSFTTEVRFWFKYDSSKKYELKFVGDDDDWVFINKKLAVDIGGIHTAVQGDLTITNGSGSVVTSNTWSSGAPPTTVVSDKSTVNLGLQNGQVYEIAVFQAERQTKASSYQLSLGGFNAAHSICKPVCGGSNPGVSPGEQCDNGDAGNCDPTASDCYNQCTTSCTLGPRCGDGIVQSNDGEQCDNGTNTDGYAAAGSNACSPDCTLPPNCGDGKVQLDYGEACDNGADNSDTAYGGCTTTCKLGPYCGDGKVNGDTDHPEACDDGINDGTYGTCSPGCTTAPHCGDGLVQQDWGEQCEPTSSDDPNCTQDCKLPGYCGDAMVQADMGEQCDDGTDKNDGTYGGCNSNCTLAGYCGDGFLTNPPEECDLGAAYNTGDYGGCTAQCKLGPHCGDGVPNGPEECDDGTGPTGNGTAQSHCTTACKKYVGIAG